jgi:RND superfamily putative drug exporter
VIGPQTRAAVARLTRELARHPVFGGPVVERSGETTRLTVPIAGDPVGERAVDAVRELRGTLIPAAVAGTSAEVLVTGDSAMELDFHETVEAWAPVVFAFVLGLSLVLLTIAFRSIVVPVKAVLLNLLSVGAAWGLMVIVWQHGPGSDAPWGIEVTNAVNVEMPIVIFAFLFGISMDYQVFLLSRMREAYDATGSTDAAVVEGIGRTGRLVTSAALILGLAFVAMSAGPGTEAKMFATALGGGILLDATLIRGVLAPALVSLFGRWNWWLPRRSARLLRVEPSPSPAPAPHAA